MSIDELMRAQEALTRAEWQTARDGFERVLQAGEAAEALEGLGMAAWWLDDAPSVFAARERAFQLYRKRDERRGAGRVALTLAQDYLYFRGETAVASGWFARAHRLLDPLEPCPEQGWLKITEGDFAFFMQHDPVTARALAVEAAAIGRAFAILDLEMMGLALEGLTLVCEGRLEEGMPRLDEATTAAVSGEMEDLYAIGFAYCCLVQACERVRDYERAAQWCSRAKDYATRVRFELLVAICGTQHASVLTAQGAWNEAERELEAAIHKLRSIRPPLEDEGVVRLARLRRLQGRREEAETLLGRCDAHPLALIERSELALESSDPVLSARLAERFLRQTHDADITERVRGLEVLLRAHLALGLLANAQQTLSEFLEVARALGTNPVRAAALLAQGLLATSTGEHDGALTAIEDSIDLFRKSGAPLEEARARVELARVLDTLAHRDAATAEAGAAAKMFEALGAADDVRRTAELLAELEHPSPVPARGRRFENLTEREFEVLQLVAEGLSNAKIAAQLYVSEFTVKRHVANILTKLKLPTRAAAAAYLARNHMA